MALRTLMLKKELDTKRKAYDALISKDAEFEARNAELEASIEEAETDEEKQAVREAIDAYEVEVEEHENAKVNLDEEIRQIESDLKDLEDAQAVPTPAEEPKDAPEETRKEVKVMDRRKFYGMNMQERTEFFARDDVQGFLTEVRSCIREKRALNNVGLTIPEVITGLIKENILEYSKLYKHVNVRQINGNGREVVMGTIPEAVWTDCCANLNDLDLSFADVELNCWKVGGYYAICNANIEDSDIDLTNEIIAALGAAIGIALDKAILYGTGTRMPLGVMTRLAQTAKPSDYPASAREWADLHTTNVAKIDSSKMSATELFAAIVNAFGAAKGKYSMGEKVFAMNEKTYTALAAAAVSVDAAGNIVTGVLDRMPVVGGAIEVLDFVQDNVIIGGYFDLYLLAERAGSEFASSEHVKFLADQTVMKGTARYDGQPAIAEGFVAIGIGNTAPTATMTFAADEANTEASASSSKGE